MYKNVKIGNSTHISENHTKHYILYERHLSIQTMPKVLFFTLITVFLYYLDLRCPPKLLLPSPIWAKWVKYFWIVAFKEKVMIIYISKHLKSEISVLFQQHEHFDFDISLWSLSYSIFLQASKTLVYDSVSLDRDQSLFSFMQSRLVPLQKIN